MRLQLLHIVMSLVLTLEMAFAQEQDKPRVLGSFPAGFLSAQASPPRQLSGPPSASRRTTAKPEGLTAEMEAFLKKLIATYQKAETYRDHGRVKLVQKNGRVKTTTEMPMELAFRRPKHLLLDVGQYTVASDGKQLLFVVPDLNQFTAVPAPDVLEKRHLQGGSILGGADEGHPELIDFLIEPNAYQSFIGQITRILWKPDIVVDGTPCRVFSYRTVLDTEVVCFVDAARMVLLKVTAETSPNNPLGGTAGAIASPPQPPTSLVYELGVVELNAKLGDETFAFKPSIHARRVRQIGADESGLDDVPSRRPTLDAAAEGGHLLGKPAPLISGMDLNGRPLVTAELRDKAVLLFFWSMAGGEHCLKSIPLVQQVADHFKDRPEVLVLGVSGDAERRDIVAQLMERKKASFRTLINEGTNLQLAFQLGGVPTFMVIGRDGNVAWAKLGAPPSLREDLISALERARALKSGK